jgi:hypothetical protein
MCHLYPFVLQECAAGTVMGGGLGLVILAFCYLWSGIANEVGVTVAIALPVRRPPWFAGAWGVCLGCYAAWLPCQRVPEVSCLLHSA